MSELAAALVRVSTEIKNPAFDSTNPHFKNKFASLAAVRNTVVPVFAKHGLSVIQNLTTSPEGIGCETIILHSSGETMRFGPLILPPTKADAQGFGSAATYARRYSLMAVAGIVGDDDDDANGAVSSAAERAKHTKAVNEYSKRVTEALNRGLESAAVDIMREAKDIDENFMADIWHTFSTPVRNRLKDLSGKAA